MIGERISRARKSKGFSMEKLAQLAGNITKQSIHKYESGQATPGSDVLISLSKALRVKPEYFFRPVEINLQKVNLRKKVKLSVTERRSIEENAKDFLERYLTLEDVFPPKEIKIKPFEPLGFKLKEPATAEVAAKELRNKWNLGLAPIENMTELLEDNGVKVLEVECSDKFDGLSGTVDDEHAVIVIGHRWPGERQRFTLAHELGHLTLDISPNCESKEREKCCHRFAAAFLAPEDMVKLELGEIRNHISHAELFSLKEKYGLSVSAWIYRAYDLGIISRSLLERFYRDLSKRGWRKDEPDKLPPEKPTRFLRLLYHALAEGMISESKASDLLGVKINELSKKLSEDLPEEIKDGFRWA